jgi:gamma-glutamylputrescine oxidase
MTTMMLPRARAAGPMTPMNSSYYETVRSSASNEIMTPSLQGDVAADVCIVGGGLLGLSTALHLAERGRAVVLLERARVGAGASGRSGGFVLPGFAAGLGELTAAAGTDEARRLWDRTLDAMSLVDTLIRRHAIDCRRTAGVVTAALSEAHRRELERGVRLAERVLGYRALELMDKGALAARVASPRYHGGLVDHEAFSIEPLDFTRGLARAARDAGVRIFTESPAQAISGDEPFTLTTPSGRVTARHVVLAANAAIASVDRQAGRWIGRALLPAWTFMIATAPLDPAMASALLPGANAVYDTSIALNYYRLARDGRLLFGGGFDGRDWPAARIRRHLIRQLRLTFPALADLPIEFAWSGPIDLTWNRLPEVGRAPGGAWFAQGFCGHGLALATWVGRALAEAIDGDEAALAPLLRLRHRRIALPGPVARMMVPLGLLAERVRRTVGHADFVSI